MSAQKRKVIGLGFMGLVLIVLGVKSLPDLLSLAAQQINLNGKPAILFFNQDDPCECMVDLTQQAEDQIANWPAERRGGITLVRISIDQRRDLEAKYEVFRTPCLVLVDAGGKVAWRQDYPLIEGGPFDLEELEAAIGEMGWQ